MNLTLERTICSCHPETCDCDPYKLLLDGKKIANVYDPSGLTFVIKEIAAKDTEIAGLRAERDRLIYLLDDAREQQSSSTTRAWRAEDEKSILMAERDKLLKVREAADALAEQADIIMRIVGDNQPCTFKSTIDAYKEARDG